MDNYFSKYVHSALTGDETAYETLYNLTKDSLFFAVLNITKNDQDALNIMKESYTHAFENLDTLDKPEIFDIWLNRIAAYSAYIFITEKNSTAFSNIVENFEWNDEDNFDKLPQETIDDKDTRNVVKDILENLPDDQRLLTIMHYYQEMSVSAISSTIDLPETTVMCILSSAREQIKKEIARAESEGRLMRSVSLGAVPFTLMELAKSQFLFHPAPPMSNIITPPTSSKAVIEETNNIQSILNIPSPAEPEQQSQNTEADKQTPEPIQQEYANPYKQPQQPTQQEYSNPYEQPQQPAQQKYSNPYEQPQQPVQQDYANPYEQAQQPTQQEYANPYEQAQQPTQQEYANPYEQAQQPTQQEYANPYEQAQQPAQQEYANPYEQAQQPAQQEYPNPYEQPQQPTQQEYSNPYEQAQQPAQQEPTAKQTQNVQAVSEQPSNNAPQKPQPYQRTLESNFSVSNTPKKKVKKQDVKQNKEPSQLSKFLKSKAGIATVAGVAFVVVAGVTLYYISNAAKNSSISIDGMTETPITITSNTESSHEPTSEELRSQEIKADEKNYVYKEYSNGTLHIVGYNGKLEDIVIPEKHSGKIVTGIDPMAFENCSQIKSVTISKNIQSISLDNLDNTQSYNPFYNCVYMKNIYVDKENKYFTSIDGVLYNKDVTKLLFYPSHKSDKTYTVPESVTEISFCAFQRNGIVTEITLPKGLKTMKAKAFLDCASLKKINIPSGITKIEWSLFSGCKALTEITLPDGITEIGLTAFYDCSSIRKITIPKSVNRIRLYAFADCTLLDTCTIENNNITFDETVSLYKDKEAVVHLIENTDVPLDNNKDTIFTNTQVTLVAKKGSNTEKYAKKYGLYFSYM
ncbi:MAG: sigma-70 family RNA polymerase sigma factor [Candidatus Pseudoruminococcus sp.]|nr:sigma-70 family RNA polymerase sigma factor [Candidatus Pseudoruminococcus sp.]